MRNTFAKNETETEWDTWLHVTLITFIGRKRNTVQSKTEALKGTRRKVDLQEKGEQYEVIIFDRHNARLKQLIYMMQSV
jgi:hypothetical protein